jgi:hypothetical protein
MAAHACSHSIMEVEVGGHQVQGQLGLCNKTLSLKQKIIEETALILYEAFLLGGARLWPLHLYFFFSQL